MQTKASAAANEANLLPDDDVQAKTAALRDAKKLWDEARLHTSYVHFLIVYSPGSEQYYNKRERETERDACDLVRHFGIF